MPKRGMERSVAAPVCFSSHASTDGEPYVVITEQARAAKQLRSSGELAQLYGLAFGNRTARRSVSEEGDQAMRLDLRNFRELLLQVIRGAQDFGAQWIRCLQHQESLLAFGVHVFEVHRGPGARITGHDETADRRVRGDLQGAVDSSGGEDDEDADDPEPCAQHAEENLVHRFEVHTRGSRWGVFLGVWVCCAVVCLFFVLCSFFV